MAGQRLLSRCAGGGRRFDQLYRVTTPKKDAAGRGCSGFDPLADRDAELFQTLMGRRALLARLHQPRHPDPVRIDGSSSDLRADPKKESAKVSRTFRRFYAHGLIAKIPRTRRGVVTLYGRRVMGTSPYLRNHDFPKAYFRIAP
jgi:hypothetical protein